MTDGNSSPAPVSVGEPTPASDVIPVAVKTGRSFSPVRVMVAAQIVTIGFAVWFMISSTSLTCIESGDIGSTICLVHTVNSCLWAVAVAIERKWGNLLLPLLSWFVVCNLVAMWSH